MAIKFIHHSLNIFTLNHFKIEMVKTDYRYRFLNTITKIVLNVIELIKCIEFVVLFIVIWLPV